MFFKSDKNYDKESVNIAFYSTFIFWAGFLLINSFLKLLNKEIQINSIYLLLSGILVFFISEQISKYIKRIKK
ncbi:hypothetical protein J6TS2_33000 [Heyndrickxia sporothermodurans]|nr:hypothetical protein J6TS2_33000 [Heyndrickxia sporothermodurans]